ncbi:hypothetical protein JKP88DRAFT_231354 [Tribonema minus]|uniref:MYND-type domain-containing protein n=1 Tax=Tribonema minus TaxID=303371 RepID=A0A835ZE31_9STRA|nr:hypothetical protein JKP88DRAFT_231354 [Tribonema minus]
MSVACARPGCTVSTRLLRVSDAVGAGETPLMFCKQCRSVRHCSRECQASHWPKHKEQCNKMKAVRSTPLLL